MSRLVSTLLHIIDTKILRSWVKSSIWYISIHPSSHPYLTTYSNPQVWKSFPYLTTDHFPHNWAIADMVKGYLVGTRKEHHHQAREDEAGHNGINNPRSKKPSRDSDTDNVCSSSSMKSGKTKISTDSDAEDLTDKDLPSMKPSTQITVEC